MSSANLAKLRSDDLGALIERIALPDEARPAAEGAQSAPDLLERLLAGGFLAEATRVVAHALPAREAVWWACMCARHTAPDSLAAPDRAAVEAAEQWVRRPGEELRRRAFDVAQASGFRQPEAWAAVAAFWSGDSISPAGQPAVAPPVGAAGLAVAGAVALAAVRGEPQRQTDRLRRFLDSARDIAAGGTGRLPPEDAAPAA